MNGRSHRPLWHLRAALALRITLFATANAWIVISMKNDWKRIFPFDPSGQ